MRITGDYQERHGRRLLRYGAGQSTPGVAAESYERSGGSIPENGNGTLGAVTDPTNPQRVVSPAGFVFDPALDTFERPPVCDVNEDGDGDGVVNEVDAALLDHMEFYLMNYFKPGRSQIDSFVQRGLRVFQQIGCTHCHIQNLTIEKDRRVADVETRFDPQSGIFNRLFATAIPLFDVVDDGEEFPQRLPRGDSFVVQNIFTDLKRHDLGPHFHERNYDG